MTTMNEERAGFERASAAQSAPAGAGAVHDGLPLVIAGAIFDFAGFLTTRTRVIEVGETANASPVAELVREWAEIRGLSLADAAVLSWQDLLVARQRTQSARVPEPVYMMRRLDQDPWYVTTFQTFEHINSGKSPQHEAVKLYPAAPAPGKREGE